MGQGVGSRLGYRSGVWGSGLDHGAGCGSVD